MAFSFRKMISNITYFKKPGEEEKSSQDSNNITVKNNSELLTTENNIEDFDYEHLEPDSTSRQIAESLKLPDSVKNFAIKKGSLSDTDLLSTVDTDKKQKRKSRKLKLDIKKANKSNSELNTSEEKEDLNLENTPKHVHLQCNSSEVFTERMKAIDFKKSFDLFDELSDDQISTTYDVEDCAIESLSESESEASTSSHSNEIKMCRKVSPTEDNLLHIPSATPESFGVVELDQLNDDGSTVFMSYQMKLKTVENFLTKLFSDFQFHAEVSKLFNGKQNQKASNVISQISNNMLRQAKLYESRGVSSAESWNVVIDKTDQNMKVKVKKQLFSLKHVIEQFINYYLAADKASRTKHCQQTEYKKTRKQSRKLKIRKQCDFPDFQDALNNLFSSETNETVKEPDTVETPRCNCKCNCSQADSGLSKIDQSMSNQSITSSIGNFSLDNTTLSAYSESLDLIISYNSFDESSLYCTLLRKPAVDRITFYIQVHSIEITSQTTEQEFESKNMILFYCPSCKVTETEENGVLKHILSQSHCEKIHFIYKTAYIKKCVASGVEIQPSTVLNPMKMYRDYNKIVCFGDAKYACSLCFENMIVGESVLMGHCSEPEHVDRRERLPDILD